MSLMKFTTINNLNTVRFQELLNANPQHPHIHLVDMPFRVTSTWQDHDCEFGVWENDNKILAWAVFQPPWRNLDYAILPSERGSSLEKEVFEWGKVQMMAYSKQTGEDFYGSIEFFEDTPNVERTVEHLETLGFNKHAVSTFRFEIDLHQEFPQCQLPNAYIIRPSRGKTKVDDYVNLIQAVFGSDWMTKEWRTRTLEHPAYRPDIDLVIANSENIPVGFCLCWLWQDISQIEPLGVHPDYQRKGLGKALEHAAFEALQNQGARYLYVDHGSLNEKAIALSLKTGFRHSNNVLRYYINTNL